MAAQRTRVNLSPNADKLLGQRILSLPIELRETIFDFTSVLTLAELQDRLRNPRSRAVALGTVKAIEIDKNLSIEDVVKYLGGLPRLEKIIGKVKPFVGDRFDPTFARIGTISSSRSVRRGQVPDRRLVIETGDEKDGKWAEVYRLLAKVKLEGVRFQLPELSFEKGHALVYLSPALYHWIMQQFPQNVLDNLAVTTTKIMSKDSLRRLLMRVFTSYSSRMAGVNNTVMFTPEMKETWGTLPGFWIIKPSGAGAPGSIGTEQKVINQNDRPLWNSLGLGENVSRIGAHDLIKIIQIGTVTQEELATLSEIYRVKSPSTVASTPSSTRGKTPSTRVRKEQENVLLDPVAVTQMQQELQDTDNRIKAVNDSLYIKAKI